MFDEYKEINDKIVAENQKEWNETLKIIKVLKRKKKIKKLFIHECI